MNLTEIAFRLAVILLPGIIAARILDIITSHKAWSQFQYIINAVLFGFSSYLVLEIFVHIPICISYGLGDKINSLLLPYGQPLTVWNMVIMKNTSIPIKEVFFALPIGIALGLIVSYIDSKRLINRLAQRLALSNKYGNANLYSHFLGADDVQVVYVRRKDTGHIYHGIVVSYSETESFKELVLSDVKVYDYETADLLYDSKKVYLSLPPIDTSIEVANSKNETNEPGITITTA